MLLFQELELSLLESEIHILNLEPSTWARAFAQLFGWPNGYRRVIAFSIALE